MKSPRAPLLWTAALICLPLLAWMSAWAWVQFRVQRDVAALREISEPREHPPGSERDSAVIIKAVRAHGCRALPALLAELEDDIEPVHAMYVCTALMLTLNEGGIQTPRDLAEMLDGLPRGRPWTHPKLKANRDSVRNWWTRNGEAVHQSWRFWSTACPRRPLTN